MSLFDMLSVSASGMAAQRTRVETMVENMANSETTRTPSGGPYRPKEVVFGSAPQTSPFASVFQQELAGTGVQIAEVMEGMGEPEKRYIPGHPDADQDGYVAFPNMNLVMDMADMMSAMRGYEFNVSAMGIVKDMINKTVDLIKS